MISPRGRFAGVLQILQYNWHFYAASLLALIGVGALLWLRPFTGPIQALLLAGATAAIFWSLGSLLVSYYIYDYKAVTCWAWIPQALSVPPRQWLNIHSGLDESTLLLTQFFPNTPHTVVDIYDPKEMTEPSIARARRLHPAPVPALEAKLDALPLPTSSSDTLFLLFAAHEIRDPARRTIFFLECHRVLADSGQLLLVEHLRDWKNFLAFGPGFLHFQSRNEWLRLASDTDFVIQREQSLTPWVRCFLLTKTSKRIESSA